jgi:hypothetical protein
MSRVPQIWALARDVEDHFPLVLRYNSDDWGSEPFRFKNFGCVIKTLKMLLLRHEIHNSYMGGWDLFLKSG